MSQHFHLGPCFDYIVSIVSWYREFRSLIQFPLFNFFLNSRAYLFLKVIHNTILDL